MAAATLACGDGAPTRLWRTFCRRQSCVPTHGFKSRACRLARRKCALTMTVRMTLLCGKQAQTRMKRCSHCCWLRCELSQNPTLHSRFAFAVAILQQFNQSVSHGPFRLSFKKSRACYSSHARPGPELCPYVASCRTVRAMLLVGDASVCLRGLRL